MPVMLLTMNRFELSRFCVLYISLFLWTMNSVRSIEINITDFDDNRCITIPVKTMVIINCFKESPKRIAWNKIRNGILATFEYSGGACVLKRSSNQLMRREKQNCEDGKYSVVFTNIWYSDSGSWKCRTDRWSSKEIIIDVISDTPVGIVNNPPETSPVPIIAISSVGGFLVLVAVIVGLVIHQRQKRERQDNIAVQKAIGRGATSHGSRPGDHNTPYCETQDTTTVHDAVADGAESSGYIRPGSEVSKPEGYSVPYAETQDYSHMYAVIGANCERSDSSQLPVRYNIWL